MKSPLLCVSLTVSVTLPLCKSSPGARAHVLVIPEVTGMRTHHGWPIGRRCCQGLNAGLLVIRDRHHAQLPTGLAPPIFIDDLDLLVDVQHAGHFDFEVRVPFLHVVSNLVRP